MNFSTSEATSNDNGDSPSSHIAQVDIRIYVILVLVPVLLLVTRMWWVYIYRRRQQLRQRSLGQRLSDQSACDSTLSKPPPSYLDLFGKAAHFGKSSSVYAISRDNVPICSVCQSIPCSVALIVDPNRKSDYFELARETDVREANRRPSFYFGSSSTGPAKIYTEMDVNKTVSSQEVDTTMGLLPSTVSVHIENELLEKRPPEPTSIISSRPSNSFRNNKEEKLEHLPLNVALLKSLTISSPCPCKCHRTIPPKKTEETCSHHNGGNNGANYSENRLPHPAMDDTAANGQQSELPSYEVALELLKEKNCEA